MDRLELAYTLMALVAAALATFVGWRIYHSRGRTLQRQRACEVAAHDLAMSKAREKA